MCMWPQPLLYRPIIGGFGLRDLGLLEPEEFLNGGSTLKICEKKHFEGNLCYHTSHIIIWLQKEEPLRD
jgi:hypothetical protein